LADERAQSKRDRGKAGAGQVVPHRTLHHLAEADRNDYRK
jgi:hypothetical protein